MLAPSARLSLRRAQPSPGSARSYSTCRAGSALHVEPRGKRAPRLPNPAWSPWEPLRQRLAAPAPWTSSPPAPRPPGPPARIPRGRPGARPAPFPQRLPRGRAGRNPLQGSRGLTRSRRSHILDMAEEQSGEVKEPPLPAEPAPTRGGVTAPPGPSPICGPLGAGSPPGPAKGGHKKLLSSLFLPSLRASWNTFA